LRINRKYDLLGEQAHRFNDLGLLPKFKQMTKRNRELGIRNKRMRGNYSGDFNIITHLQKRYNYARDPLII